MKPKITFYEKVDLRSRSEMVDFLREHFRYDTMNSWNHSTAYANKVKIFNVIPRELHEKAFELLQTDELPEAINDLIYWWDKENEHQYQAGFNGRSGGYVVMYNGGVEYKTIFTFSDGSDRDYADGYGWKSREEAEKQGLLNKRIRKIITWPGRDIDHGEDFSGWTMDELRSRVKLVQSFDKLCDDIVQTTIDMCKSCKIEEETYFVERKRKVVKCDE